MDVVRLHQAGITYAVATLGTATTQEHLNKLFRLTSEVVFCFDGDRAGRQAAWRALENALPLARDGREMKFMFLPEGHDPDTPGGRDGAEGFEARLKEALPLSQYLVDHLKVQVDLTHVDGRARLKALAQPLVRQDARGGVPGAAGGPAGGGDPHAGRETQRTAAGRHHAGEIGAGERPEPPPAAAAVGSVSGGATC